MFRLEIKYLFKFKFCAFLSHKWRNLIEHNNKYLLTSLAVVKRTCFDHIDRHVGQRSRREYSYNLQRMANIQDHNIKRCVDTDTNSNWQRTRQKREEKKFQPKRLIVKFHATKFNVTCNSCIYHYQVLTCNMQK